MTVSNHPIETTPASPSQIKQTVYTSLFVALIAVGAYIAVPIGPVPIVLQNMFVLLAGLILGPVRGLACLGVYLLIGAAGLPVFAGGKAGIGVVFGPTGGYLLGYLPAVFVAGALSRTLGRTLTGDIIAAIVASLIVYAAGVPWLKVAFSMSWGKAVSAGMLPFLIGDAVKIVLAALIAKKLRPLVKL